MARLFRVLALLFPSESFERIQRGLQSKNPKARASSRELLEHLVAPSLRAAVLALVEDVPDADRLARVPPGMAPVAIPYEKLLASFVERDDELGILARYHAAETGQAPSSSSSSTSKSALIALLAPRTPRPVTDAS